MAQAPKTTTAKPETKKDKTVQMVRDAAQFPKPHTADVHPAEVDNYRAAGWQEA